MDQQNLEIIRTNLKGTAVINRLMMSLGYAAGDESGRLEATKYAATVLAEVEKTAGDDKKDLTGCTWESISQCMIDAARFRLFIDARQHAHLIKFFNKTTRQDEAQLQIGYRAYLAKISEHYEDVDFTATNIYKGDQLDIEDHDGFQSYKMKKADPFNDKFDDYRGTMVAISYGKGNHRFQKVTTLSKDEIQKIRRKAKFDSVWSEWFGEKAKAASIKRAGKIHFASIQGLQDLIKYDNEKNFDMDKAEAPVSGGIIDNLNNALDGVASPQASLPQPETNELDGLNSDPIADLGEDVYVTVDRDYETQPESQPVQQEQLIEETPPAAEPTNDDNMKSIAEQIRVHIKYSKDTGDLFNLWTIECKDDLTLIRNWKQVTYDFLKKEYDEKMKSFEIPT